MMKKAVSILLLGILLFNWCGYRWVLNWMQQQAATQLEAKLDANDYDEAQLIEITIPLNMPYMTSQANFERCDGQVEVNGKQYKYVKRKIDNGQLVLKCIASETTQRLQSARDNFFKLVNDLQQDHSAKKTGSNTGIAKNLAGDYDDQHSAAFVSAMYTGAVTLYGHFTAPSLTQLLRATPEQPPEA